MRKLAEITGFAVASPDGKWIGATPGQGTPPIQFRLYDSGGVLVRTFELPVPNWSWMPDSSGIFVALDAPQRASQLGVIDITGGAARDTGLQMASPTLSRDGRSIVAEQQEGCCVSIMTKEIWAAPRSGGAARVVAKTTTTEASPVALLGVDAQDRVVYRDAGDVVRVAVGGGATQRIGAVPVDWRRTIAGTMSPDRTVAQFVAVNPSAWLFATGDRVLAWPNDLGSIVTTERTFDGQPIAAVWTADHSVLVRDSTGKLATVDVVTTARTGLSGVLQLTDIPFAYGRLQLLVSRGGVLVVLDIQTNALRDTGIDLGQNVSGVLATALPGGGFVVTTPTGTYRID